MLYRYGYDKGTYTLWKEDKKLCSFTLPDIRFALEEYADINGESSHWIGRMITIFRHTFTFPDDIIRKPHKPEDYPLNVLIRYLKDKGYRIYTSDFHPDMTDKQIIDYLLSRDFVVEKDGIREKYNRIQKGGG